jgi:hypothetical protein
VIKILFLSANPTDTQSLRLGEEMRAIQEKLQASPLRDSFIIEQHWAVRSTDLEACLLQHKPQIVHFSGHGRAAGQIVLQDESGESQPVLLQGLKELFELLKGDISCVVLNSCYSGRQAKAIAESIPCVVGMSGTIGDDAAIAFAASFYQALGYGKSIKAAFDLARVQVHLNSFSGRNAPELITREGVDPDMVRLTNSQGSDSALQAQGSGDKASPPATSHPTGARRPWIASAFGVPLLLLKQAIKGFPPLKFALGLAALAAVIAIVKTLVTDVRVAVFGIVVMIALMTLLLVFANLTNLVSRQTRAVLVVLLWFSLLIFIATGSSLFGSVFFRWPVNLRSWIVTEPPAQPQPLATSPKSVRYAWSRQAHVYHYIDCCWVKMIAPENVVTGDVPPEGRELHRGCPTKESNGSCGNQRLPEPNVGIYEHWCPPAREAPAGLSWVRCTAMEVLHGKQNY